MRQDDVRRLCLDCSVETGRLAWRVCVVSEKRKERAASKAKAKQQRAAAQRREYPNNLTRLFNVWSRLPGGVWDRPELVSRMARRMTLHVDWNAKAVYGGVAYVEKWYTAGVTVGPNAPHGYLAVLRVLSRMDGMEGDVAVARAVKAITGYSDDIELAMLRHICSGKLPGETSEEQRALCDALADGRTKPEDSAALKAAAEYIWW